MFELWPEILGGASQKQLAVTYRAQMNKKACWAAVAQMVAEVVAGHKSGYDNQLDLFRIHKKSGSNSLDVAMAALGVDAQYAGAAFDFVDVVYAVDGGQPLVYHLEFKGEKNSHVGVIAGYGKDKTGGEWVYILDPDDKAFMLKHSSAFGWMKFGDLKQPQNPGITWTGTYYNLAKK